MTSRVRLRRGTVVIVAVAIVAVAASLVAVRYASVSSPTAARWQDPPAHQGFDYQIGGPYTPQKAAEVVVRDWHVDPAAGHYDVCYVDAFETQAEAETWWTTKHPQLLLRHDGGLVEDPNWANQYLLDTSTAAKRSAIAAVEEPWIRSCASKGYDAVEFDNLDSWYRSGDSLTTADNLALARALVTTAHGLGLAVAQKNAAALKGEGKRVAHFDFAIAESCEVYSECDSYLDAYGDRVFEIEYTDESGDPFARACAARGTRISVIQRDRLVVPEGNPAYRYAAC